MNETYAYFFNAALDRMLREGMDFAPAKFRAHTEASAQLRRLGELSGRVGQTERGSTHGQNEGNSGR